jgi:DNA-binding SARP family transcriptional activator
MKVAHKDTSVREEPGNWLDKAKELESGGELEKAVAAFERVIKHDPLNQYAYDRLMIIHRKNKDYKKEKAIIIAGIRSFEQFYQDASRVVTPTTKIISLSKALMKATGLADKKGKVLYQKEPVGRWNKRKRVVEKKLNA